jgi:thioester reductase-like protein
MPVQMAGPHSSRVPDTARRTVLLTGASGVVGRGLLHRLRDLDVVCLVHRSPVSGPNVTAVPGDVAKPMFGLAERAYVDLAAKVDAVIHCAAVTDFNRADGCLEATNISGTGHVAAFAAAADAVLYHVSTAFVHTTVEGDRGRTAIGYASSKLAAEGVVRSSGVPHVILRPSVVIGDSVTGEIAAFQGLHQVAAGILAGIVPMIPFAPAGRSTSSPSTSSPTRSPVWLRTGSARASSGSAPAIRRCAWTQVSRSSWSSRAAWARASTCRGLCRRTCSTG